MKKEKELRQALMKILKFANEQNIKIDSVTLPLWWFSHPLESCPEQLLGIKISNK